MQITIYLSEELIDQVEALARKKEMSRSAVIQEILTEGIQKRKKGTSSHEMVRLFGAWKLSGAEQNEIRRIRGKDVRLAKMR